VFTRIGPVFSGSEMSALWVVNCSLTCLGFDWKSLRLADETTVSVAIFFIYQIGNCPRCGTWKLQPGNFTLAESALLKQKSVIRVSRTF